MRMQPTPFKFAMQPKLKYWNSRSLEISFLPIPRCATQSTRAMIGIGREERKTSVPKWQKVFSIIRCPVRRLASLWLDMSKFKVGHPETSAETFSDFIGHIEESGYWTERLWPMSHWTDRFIPDPERPFGPDEKIHPIPFLLRMEPGLTLEFQIGAFAGGRKGAQKITPIYRNMAGANGSKEVGEITEGMRGRIKTLYPEDWRLWNWSSPNSKARAEALEKTLATG